MQEPSKKHEPPWYVHSPKSHDHLKSMLSTYNVALSVETARTISKPYQFRHKGRQAWQGVCVLEDLIKEVGNAEGIVLPGLARYNGVRRPEEFLMFEVRKYIEPLLEPTVLSLHEFLNTSGDKYKAPRRILNEVVQRHRTTKAKFTQILRSSLNSKHAREGSRNEADLGDQYGFIVGQVHNRYLAEAFAASLETGAVYILTDIEPSKSASARLRIQQEREEGKEVKELSDFSDMDIVVVSSQEAIRKALKKMRKLNIKSYNKKLLAG